MEGVVPESESQHKAFAARGGDIRRHRRHLRRADAHPWHFALVHAGKRHLLREKAELRRDERLRHGGHIVLKDLPAGVRHVGKQEFSDALFRHRYRPHIRVVRQIRRRKLPRLPVQLHGVGSVEIRFQPVLLQKAAHHVERLEIVGEKAVLPHSFQLLFAVCVERVPHVFRRIRHRRRVLGDDARQARGHFITAFSVHPAFRRVR